MSARSPRGLRPPPAAPSFSAGSCSLPSPEGRLGVCAWALRGRGRKPRSARAKGASHEKDHIMTTPAKSEQDRVVIFDTTLREIGRASCREREKVEVYEGPRDE